MAGDFKGRRNVKNYYPSIKFLEQACAFIELSNLLDSKLRHIKDCQIEAINEIQRSATWSNRATAEEGVFATGPMQQLRRARRRHGATLYSSLSANSIQNSIEKKFDTLALKKLNCSQQDLHRKIDQNKNRLNRSINKYSSNRRNLLHYSINKENVQTTTSERENEKKLYKLDSDFADCIQLHFLPDLLSLTNVYKEQMPLNLKTNDSNFSFKSWKNLCSFYDILSKQDFKKRDKLPETNEMDAIKMTDTKSSLHSQLNLSVTPTSNKIHLKIKTNQGMNGAASRKSDTLSFSFPYQFISSNDQEEIKTKVKNILPPNLSTSSTELSATPPTKISNELEMKNLKLRVKMQTVYTREVPKPRIPQGIHSKLYIKFNISRSPSISEAPPSRPFQVCSDSKLSLDKRTLQAVTGYTYDSTTVCSSNRQQSICQTCCQTTDCIENARGIDRDGYICSDSPPLIFSPIAFFKKCCVKFKIRGGNSVTNVSSRPACSPKFKETKHCSVQEENVYTECSWPKRVFGQLMVSKNKCSETKYRLLNSDNCTSGTRVSKRDPFACFKKIMTKFQTTASQKDKETKKIKKDKDQVRKERIKEKKRRLGKRCVLTTVFEHPIKDDDSHKSLDVKGFQERCQVECRTTDSGINRECLRGGTEFMYHPFTEEPTDSECPKPRKPGEKSRATETRRATAGRENGRSNRSKGWRFTRRVRERYSRNKDHAEQSKGDYSCDFYMMSLRTKPCLWVYYMFPRMYPYCLNCLNCWRQLADLLLFFVAIFVWSPCIICMEVLKLTACNLFGS